MGWLVEKPEDLDGTGYGDGEVPTWDTGTSKFVPATPAGGGGGGGSAFTFDGGDASATSGTATFDGGGA